MKVTADPGIVQVERRFTVEDGPAVEADYRKGSFRVRRIYFRWKLKEGAWMLETIEISGGILRKDGTPREDFNGQTNRRWSYLDQAPSWLQAIALAAWPTGHLEYAAIVDRTFEEL